MKVLHIRTALGMLLVLAGIGLMGYVVYAYLTIPRAATPTWSPRQQQKADRIVAAIIKHHQMALPHHVQGPVPGSEPPVRLVIPALQLDVRIVQTPPRGGVWPVPDWAVGHLTTSANPGGAGNMELAGHDDIKGEVFKRIGQLEPGTPIRVYTRHAQYVYLVTRELVVDPTNTSVLEPTSLPTLTMITCTPYWIDSQRLVVQAILKPAAA